MKLDRVKIRIVSPGEDPQDDARLADLAARALEPNPFFSNVFMTAYNQHKAKGKLKLLLALDPTETHAVAALPLTTHRPGVLLKTPCALAGDYGPLGTLLIDENVTPQALSKLLSTACAQSLWNTLTLPFHGTQGPTYAKLQEALHSEHWQIQVTNTHDRAYQSGGEVGAQAFAALKKRSSWKGTFKNQRRLEKLGTLSFDLLSTSIQIEAGLETFLQLEAAGWKGKQKTALLSRPTDAGFTRQMVEERAKADGIRLGQLKLDSKVIATNILLYERGHIYGWKTTFDEAFGKYSPGQLLIYETTKALLEDPAFKGADSLSTPDNTMANKAWTDRFAYTTLTIGKGVFARAAMAEAHYMSCLKGALKTHIKRLLGRK